LLLLVEVLIEVLAELVSLVEAHAARLTLKLVRLEKQRLRNDVRLAEGVGVGEAGQAVGGLVGFLRNEVTDGLLLEMSERLERL